MKKIVLIAIVLVASFSLIAQNQIEGKVYELTKDGSLLPIFSANVYWDDTNIGTTTDINGSYSIEEAISFPANLSVSYVGYTFHSKEIVDDKYVFYLKSIVELDAVQVKGKVNTTKFSTINSMNMQTLSTGELQKAACCNLSESFSTNASVDVNFSDAISGAKKIMMLGLDGKYMQITQENIPLIRGISSSYGLNYVPGTWIESIQVIKGAGSVVNGYESFTGQINLEYFKPENADKLYWNVYTNSDQKIENNLSFSSIHEDWSSNLFTHFSYQDKEVDHNSDGFMDVPNITNINILNRFIFDGSDVFRAQIYIKGLYEDRVGGQTSNRPNPYKVDIHNDMLEVATKLGIRPNKEGNSIGSQTAFRRHNQKAQFGDLFYTGLQESAYLNLVGLINLSESNLQYGFNFNGDRYTESFNDSLFNRVDLISGLFAEYTFKSDEYFTLVAGLRSDYHNNSAMHYSPRFNLKYNPTEDLALRFSAGRAFRIANIFVENANFLASSRIVKVNEELLPEEAWNLGFNLTYCFYFSGREGYINADAYRTVFKNQVVVDLEKQGFLSFYNLTGAGFANIFQIDLGYELFDRFDLKLAYKINDAQTTFNNGEQKKNALNARDRALLNLAYATYSEKWLFDFTANYVGKSRIPTHSEVKQQFSDPFMLYNTQITKKFNYFDLYLGVENILSHTQENPIILYDDPSSSGFDASLIYAPINGRMIYFGFRYTI
jgi:outer membrane receptor for ferrienterochelin and colicin